MRAAVLLIFLFAAACRGTAHEPDAGRGEANAETRFALEQILREIEAGKAPVGVMVSPPQSDADALVGLLALGLGETTGDAPSVLEHEGFLLVSRQPLERAAWGQRGYAIRRRTGEVYAWSLW